ncbi:hypothetical protein [Streptomyces stackebrandtii]|nr:hypothetical protein [Streptomyces sp. DSM 40976]
MFGRLASEPDPFCSSHPAASDPEEIHVLADPFGRLLCASPALPGFTQA